MCNLYWYIFRIIDNRFLFYVYRSYKISVLYLTKSFHFLIAHFKIFTLSFIKPFLFLFVTHLYLSFIHCHSIALDVKVPQIVRKRFSFHKFGVRFMFKLGLLKAPHIIHPPDLRNGAVFVLFRKPSCVGEKKNNNGGLSAHLFPLYCNSLLLLGRSKVEYLLVSQYIVWFYKTPAKIFFLVLTYELRCFTEKLFFRTIFL